MKLLNIKTLLSASAMLVLTGCVGDGPKVLDAGLTSLIGQPIQTAYDRLGYPKGSQNMNGDTFYIWSTNRNVVMPVYQTGTTTGSVGNTPFQVNTTMPGMIPMNFNCTIRVITGSDNIVKSWDYQGTTGGCQGYVQALKRQGFK
jgi:hypothetical protein